jgi:GNAT superfamily N-acetyltransferase
VVCKYLSEEIVENIITAAEKCLQRKLVTKKQLLLPNSVCITDDYYHDGDPEQFIIIFDVKVNYHRLKTAIIRYYQIPLHLQHHGLGSEIYQILEDEFKKLGCQRVTLEAITNQRESGNVVVFWEHLNFKKTPYCYPDSETCPMQKEI